MRILLIIFAVFFSGILCFYGHGRLANVGGLMEQKRVSEEAVAQLEQKLARLQQYKSRDAQTLIVAYQNFYNNVLTIANVAGTNFTVKTKDPSADKDIRFAAKPSVYEGIAQIDLEATISTIPNGSSALGVFKAFSDLEKKTPISINSVRHEKDYIIFNISVYGI